MKRSITLPLAIWLGAALLTAVAPLLIDAAPREATMGVVQKIFYYHVPCAWVCFLSAFICAGGSIAYLFRNSKQGDYLAIAGAELTVLFGLCVLVTGPLWARKAWGAYWQWDVRLTTTLLLWLIFLTAIFIRRYGGPGSQKIAAGLAIFGAADVPLIYLSVSLWRTIHPKTTVVRTLDPGMRPAFWTSFFAITLLSLALLWLRARQARIEEEVKELKLYLEEDV